MAKSLLARWAICISQEEWFASNSLSEKKLSAFFDGKITKEGHLWQYIDLEQWNKMTSLETQGLLAQGLIVIAGSCKPLPSFTARNLGTVLGWGDMKRNIEGKPSLVLT